MKLALSPRRKARIEMLPLIDIVFLLLVFFIYAMLSMAVHRGLPVDLPASESAGVEQEDLLSITIRADGAVYVDKELVSLDELPAVLAVAAEGGTASDQGVLLFADRTVAYGRLFKVLDALQGAGLTRISMQAGPEIEAR